MRSCLYAHWPPSAQPIGFKCFPDNVWAFRRNISLSTSLFLPWKAGVWWWKTEASGALTLNCPPTAESIHSETLPAGSFLDPDLVSFLGACNFTHIPRSTVSWGNAFISRSIRSFCTGNECLLALVVQRPWQCKLFYISTVSVIYTVKGCPTEMRRKEARFLVSFSLEQRMAPTRIWF